MPKRFTDTSKWKDSWYQDLPSKYKLFWVYLLDECDNSGVWKPNIRLATFQIGEPFEEVEVRRILADRIEVTETGYWFVKKFIEFQYGELSPACKPHVAVINLLKNHKIKGYTKGINTLKYKEKEKEQDKEEEKESKNIDWYRKCLDEIYLDTMKSTHKGKNIEQAIVESFAHLSADSVRLYNAESSDCKKLLNTWLTNQKYDRGTNEGKNAGTRPKFSGTGYKERL